MYALQIKQLKKTYKNGFDALKGIHLNVKQGDFFALLGANGAGKSTTIGLISHLIEKTSGDIIINGYNLDTQPEEAKLSLGVVPQEFNLPVFETCEDILLNVAGYYGIGRKKAALRANWLMQQLGLGHKMKAIVHQLSGGMKRRLMIARSLMHEPKLLLLDEPSAGVDIEIRHTIWAFLKTINQQGTTIILTTHYLEEAEQLCNQLAVIHHGKIVEQASMKSLLNTHTKQTFVFTSFEPVHLEHHFDQWALKIINPHTFELTLPSQESLNLLFKQFIALDIEIQSIQHKTNRLESLFMELIKDEH